MRTFGGFMRAEAAPLPINDPTLLDDVEASSTTITSNTLNPSDNAKIIMIVGARDGNTVDLGTPGSTLANLSAWDTYGGTVSGGGPFHRVLAFVAQVTGDPGEGVVSWAGDEFISEMAMAVIEVTGNVGNVIQSKPGQQVTGTEFALELDSAPAANSLLIGAVFNAVNATDITPGADWTELVERKAISATDTLQAQYWRNPTDGVCDWAGLVSNSTSGILIEIGQAE